MPTKAVAGGKSRRSRTPPPSQARDQSWPAGVREIYEQTSTARRREFRWLLVLMLLNAFAELGTIGAVLPLLTLIGNPLGIEHYLWALQLLDLVGAGSQGARLLTATMIFSVFAVVGGVVRFELVRSTFTFSHDLAHELMLEIQRRLLSQPYSFHVGRHSSTLITALEKSEIVVFDVILPIIQGASASVISLFIIAILVAVDPLTALAATAAFAVIYLAASAFYRRQLAANSQTIVHGLNKRMKIVQESLGGIRDVIIDGSQSLYLTALEREDSRLAHARAATAIISNVPRFLVETIAVVMVAIIALFVSGRPGGFAAALPDLGAIALGGQRLIPLVQQIYRAWSTATGNLSVVGETVHLLTLAADEDHVDTRASILPLNDKISIEHVSFTYPGRRSPALEAINLEIPKGAALALVGETGSGKSTLTDLLMGLLEPERGRICVDGVPLTKIERRQWQRSIAHVPQSIFLADMTIAQNIALSAPDATAKPDWTAECAKKAQLHEFVASLPDGYETLVGERGIRLSGGQKQRLGIARAIYKKAPVIILDEATSALDELTESTVVDALNTLRGEGCTIIIVAHRLSTIRHCNLVARLDGGHIVEVRGSGQSVGAPGKAG